MPALGPSTPRPANAGDCLEFGAPFMYQHSGKPAAISVSNARVKADPRVTWRHSSRRRDFSPFFGVAVRAQNNFVNGSHFLNCRDGEVHLKGPGVTAGGAKPGSSQHSECSMIACGIISRWLSTVVSFHLSLTTSSILCP